jgi:C4-dicarboxylate transporter DctM subunit
LAVGPPIAAARGGGHWHVADGGFGKLSSSMNGLGTLWVFGLTFLILADVVGRTLFNHPVRGVAEIVAMSITGCVFLQLAHTLRQGRLTRADVLIGWLDRNNPGIGRSFHLVFGLTGAIALALVCYGTLPSLISAWNTSEFVGVQGGFMAPVWPLKLVIVFGAGATAVEHLRQSWRTLAAPDGSIWPALALVVAFSLLFWLAAVAEIDRLAVGLLSLGAMLFLIFAGMQIAVALMLLSFLGIWMLKASPVLAIKMLALAASGTISDYVFGVVPLFVLMGLLVSVADVGRETFEVAQWLVGRIRGGLGIATVAANAVFASITGVSIASAAVFTKVAVPPMIAHGYAPRFAVGVVAGSSVLGMLIPPSLLLIVYGVIAEVSVGQLFIAAIVPGLLLALAFCFGILAIALIRPALLGDVNGAKPPDPAETVGSAAKKLLPVVLLIGLVLGGIYGGVFTPTEAGAAGAFGALLIALARRRLNWRNLWDVLVETGHVSVSILFLIIAASMYSRMLALTGIPMTVADAIAGAELGFYGFITIYVLIVVAMGMVLDSTSIMLIVLPLTLPAMATFGADLLWFGIVTVIAVEIGLLTPPLGLTVYVVKATLNDSSISLAHIFAGAMPFTIMMLAVIVLLVAFPELGRVFVS